MALKGGSASTEVSQVSFSACALWLVQVVPIQRLPVWLQGEEVAMAMAEQSLGFPAEEQPLLGVIPGSDSIYFCTFPVGMN